MMEVTFLTAERTIKNKIGLAPDDERPLKRQHHIDKSLVMVRKKGFVKLYDNRRVTEEERRGEMSTMAQQQTRFIEAPTETADGDVQWSKQVDTLLPRVPNEWYDGHLYRLRCLDDGTPLECPIVVDEATTRSKMTFRTIKQAENTL